LLKKGEKEKIVEKPNQNNKDKNNEQRYKPRHKKSNKRQNVTTEGSKRCKCSINEA